MTERLDAESRRQLILETAMTVIDNEGHQNLTMRALARHFGMSAPGLMHYFSSLPALVVGVVQYRDERDEANIEFPPPAPGVVREILGAIVDNIAARPKAAELFAIVEAEAVDVNHVGHQYFKDRAADLVDRAEPYLTVEYAHPRELAAQLFAVMDGLQLHWLREPESFDLRERWEAVSGAIFAAAERV